jgi:iron complex transport system substrate-binding protein
VFRRPVLALAALLAAVVALVAAEAATPKQSATPRRIISLSPTATESLFAIGAGSQVIAVDDQSTYPKQAPQTKLSGFTPNVEAIASYKPDLVVASYDPGGLREALGRLGIRVLFQDAAKTLPESYAQILELGKTTGHADRSRKVVTGIKTQIARLVASAKNRGRGLGVYHELDPTLYSATSKTFIGRIYAMFGLRNIADAADSTGGGYPQLSAEYVVSQNPDVIVLADTACCGQNARTVSARPGWDRIRAVRTGEIVRIDDSIASRWGPRVVNFARAISLALNHLKG